MNADKIPTKGDWEFYPKDSTVIAVDDNGISTVCELNEGLLSVEANGKLIAASKELLRALKYAKQYAFIKDINTLSLIDDAIAKAEGKS